MKTLLINDFTERSFSEKNERNKWKINDNFENKNEQNGSFTNATRTK